MAERNILKGVTELHVHPSPDIQPRKFTDLELAEQMKAAGAAAVVLKSHTFPTMARAEAASRAADFPVFGSITLNDEVGGFNPVAVETALNLGAKTVWMPTKSAENHRKYFNLPGGLNALEGGRVREELESILRMIADRDVILSMGHLSFQEQRAVIVRARELGVKKIMIDHPELSLTRLTVPEQKCLQEYGVYFLRCAVYLDLSRSYGDVLYNLLELGCSDTVLSTDGGNFGLPDWPELMEEYLLYLLRHGVTEEELGLMAKDNPAGLLNLI
ncbi:DUF6282 family protein [Clostridium transplantifaecale]|uniref:DUF6282 family protein n=1 Tax=Clostridium transplantifaecale TaxID=2479838 RepID=UPI000F62C93F|nr:DUF6282 family protein [Clostridium transplantifaecale]